MKARSLLQVRNSKTGDALWVARSKRNPGQVYALDYVVERKSVTDLVHSIKHGRYEKQKYVLRRCGLRRVMYLIEGNPDVAVQGVSCLLLGYTLMARASWPAVYLEQSDN